VNFRNKKQDENKIKWGNIHRNSKKWNEKMKMAKHKTRRLIGKTSKVKEQK